MLGKQLFIEPQNSGKTLKIASLFRLNNNENKTCRIMIPNLNMRQNYEKYLIDKKYFITSPINLIGLKVDVLLIDEYFYLKEETKNKLNGDVNFIETIIAFGTPNRYYPVDLVDLIRNSPQFSNEEIYNLYISTKPFILKKYYLIDLIKELKYNFICNPNFVINNFIRVDEHSKNFNDNECGIYLIDDIEYFYPPKYEQ